MLNDKSTDDYAAALLAALNRMVKKGWMVQGIAWGQDPHVDFIKPKGVKLSVHFIEITGGIRFTEAPLLNKDVIIVNDNAKKPD